MKKTCRRLQDTLAELGAAALREDELAQRHLEECDDCFAVLEAMAEVDAAFDHLPSLDAADELVDSLLRRVEAGDGAAETPAAAGPRWRSWAAAAGERLAGPVRVPSSTPLRAALVFITLTVVCVPLYLLTMRRTEAPEKAGLFQSFDKVADASVPRTTSELEAPAMDMEVREKLDVRGYEGHVAENLSAPRLQGESEPIPEVDDIVFGIPDAPQARSLTEQKDELVRSVLSEEALQELELEMALEQRLDAGKGRRGNEIPRPQAKKIPDPTPEPEAPGALPPWVGAESDLTFRDNTSADDSETAQAYYFRGGSPRKEAAVSGPFDGDEVSRKQVEELRRQRLRELPRSAEELGDDLEKVDDDNKALAGDTESRAAARRFLAERRRVEGLGFRPASGYWSNTYVPGDPVLRHLQARLAGRDRAELQGFSAAPLRLHDVARQPSQPFDLPRNAALAVYLHADRRALEAEGRLLVQVGLRGTERYSGRRPAMNVGVVLDLRGDTAEAGAAMRALIDAFGQARDLGDRFRLVVAGRAGGLAVPPESFRHGPLTVAMQRLLAPGGGLPGKTLGLRAAVARAIAEVGRTDDPTAPLGSSVVVVVTAQPLGAELAALAQMAHLSAVAGVPLSVVGIGDGVRTDELDRLAIAGQGNRRLLTAPAEAAGVVDRELSAVARVVARAVRLRIRLAPGVRLVDVVGSRRHDQAGAERVRRAEKSIDRRLAQNLGIAADRGDDEAGIQIVLPSFYAGDSHALLLDVVAPGPGPIVDVTVRYKDLVEMGNGVTRARLELRRGEAEPGPLERNVLKSYLALRLRDALEDAGRRVAAGDPRSAAARLGELRRLLAGLALEVPGFAQDRDVERDVAMLDEYLALLGSGAAEQGAHRVHLAESMRYAGRLKILPPPSPAGGGRRP